LLNSLSFSFDVVMRRGIKKAVKLMISILLLLIFSAHSLIAQDKGRNETKALLVYSFMKYIGWSNFVDQHAIIIGVVDDPVFADDLRRFINNRLMSGKVVLVKDIGIGDVSNCQLVYLPKSRCDLSAAVSSSLKSMQVLVVQEDAKLSDNNADISIVNSGDILNPHKFIINRRSIQEKGLKISVDLLDLANMVI
jgi:hypothetical protein